MLFDLIWNTKAIMADVQLLKSATDVAARLTSKTRHMTDAGYLIQSREVIAALTNLQLYARSSTRTKGVLVGDTRWWVS